MWFSEHQNFLDIKCDTCGKELEAELEQWVAGSNNQTLQVSMRCDCISGQEEKIANDMADYSDLQEKHDELLSTLETAKSIVQVRSILKRVEEEE